VPGVVVQPAAACGVDTADAAATFGSFAKPDMAARAPAPQPAATCRHHDSVKSDCAYCFASRRRLRRRARAARRVAWVQSTTYEAAPLTQARTRFHGRAGGGFHSSAFTAVRLNPEENASQNSPQSEQVCQESFVYSALTNLGFKKN